MSGQHPSNEPTFDFFEIEDMMEGPYSQEEGGEGAPEHPENPDNYADIWGVPLNAQRLNVFELHANFDIDEDILNCLEFTPGVEIVKTLSPYRAFISIGIYFDVNETKQLVRENISAIMRGEDLWESILKVVNEDEGQ